MPKRQDASLQHANDETPPLDPQVREWNRHTLQTRLAESGAVHHHPGDPGDPSLGDALDAVFLTGSRPPIELRRRLNDLSRLGRLGQVDPGPALHSSAEEFICVAASQEVCFARPAVVVRLSANPRPI